MNTLINSSQTTVMCLASSVTYEKSKLCIFLVNPTIATHPHIEISMAAVSFM